MTAPRAALLIALFSTSLSAAETGIEFSGVLTAEGKTRIALTDTARKTTTWVEPGGEFNGFTVLRYDAKEDAVFLKKGGQETRIGLVTSKTREAPSPSAASSPTAQATTAAIRANLRQLSSAARQFQLERGVSNAAYTDLVGPDKIIKELKPVAGENYSTLTFGPNVTAVNVTTANGETVSLDLPAASATAPTGAATQIRSVPPSAPTTPSTLPAASTPPAASAAAPALSVTPTTTPAAPANAAAAAGPQTGRQPASPSYTIQGGDTWQKISESTGVPVSQLKHLNPAILEGSPLPAGQTIRVR